MASSVLSLSLLLGSARAVDLLSASRIERCINRNGEQTCDRQMVIHAAIQNGAASGSGEFQYSLGPGDFTPFQDPDDPDQFLDVADAVIIRVRQSAIRLIYPLQYIQDVNNGMYEEIRRASGNGMALNVMSNPCRAAWEDTTTATCGWQYAFNEQRNGYERIRNSAGFCCSCPAADDNLFTSTSGARWIPRPELTCSFLNRPAAGHCPRFHPLWYGLYDIGAPQMDLSIRVTVTLCRPLPDIQAAWTRAGNLTQLRCSMFHPLCQCTVLNSDMYEKEKGMSPLGPRNPNRCYPLPGRPDTACDVEFRLIGTFPSYAGTESFANKYVLIPSQCMSGLVRPGSNDQDVCNQRLVTDSPDRYLMVDKTQVSLDGSGCNKVGLGFDAFVTTMANCQNAAGTCLKGQPDDLYKEDALVEDATPLEQVPRTKYFLGNINPTTDTRRPLGPFVNDNPADFQLASPAEMSQNPKKGWLMSWRTFRFQATTFTLTVRNGGGWLRFMTYTAPGRIINWNSAPFEAGQPGTLSVHVANIGNVPSAYTLNFFCPSAQTALQPVNSAQLSLRAPLNQSYMPPAVWPPRQPMPRSETIVTFDLRVTGTGDTLDAAFNSNGQLDGCQLTLLDGQGMTMQTINVTISVTPKIREYGGQGSGSGGSHYSVIHANSSAKSGMGLCNAECSSFFDLSCPLKIAQACSERIVGLVGTSLLMGLAGTALIGKLLMMAGVLRCCGLGRGSSMMSFFRVLCCCGCKNNNNNSSDDYEDDRRDKKPPSSGSSGGRRVGGRGKQDAEQDAIAAQVALLMRLGVGAGAGMGAYGAYAGAMANGVPMVMVPPGVGMGMGVVGVGQGQGQQAEGMYHNPMLVPYAKEQQ